MALIDAFEKGSIQDLHKVIEAGILIHVYDLTKKEGSVTSLKRVKTIIRTELNSYRIDFYDSTDKYVGNHYEIFWVRE